MNEDTLKGTGKDIAGKIEETAGDVTSDNSLKADGIADQLGGKVRKVIGSVKNVLGGDVAVDSTVDRIKLFAREKPFATAAAIGVVGIALINTLRSRE
jgi:uncharacterized protein YjbJ (UPF0337 family)